MNIRWQRGFKVGLFVALGLVVLYVALVFFQFSHGPIREWAEASYGGRISVIEREDMYIIDSAGVEQVIRLASTTVVKKGRATLGVAALEVGSYVIVFGPRGSDGGIDAQMIRLLSPGQDAPPVVR